MPTPRASAFPGRLSRRAAGVLLAVVAAVAFAAVLPPGGCGVPDGCACCGEGECLCTADASCGCRAEVGTAMPAPLVLLLPLTRVGAALPPPEAVRAFPSLQPLAPAFTAPAPEAPPPRAGR